MQTLQTPSAEHAEFDQLCEGIEDFGPLPSATRSTERAEREPAEPEDDRLNEAILAGLISPV